MMKNKAKILTVVLLIVFLAFAFCACGKVDFVYKQNKDGTYTNIVTLTLDDDLSGSSFTVDEATTAFERGFTKYGYTVAKNSDVSMSAVKNFATIAELKDELNILRNGLSVAPDGISDEKSDAFMYRQDITGTAILSADYFINHEYIVKSVLIEGGLTMAKADNVIVAMKTSASTYSYVTPYRSVKSDADSITRDSNGYFVHTWKLSEGDSAVHITLSAVEGAMWYGIAVIFAAVAVLMFAIIKMIKDRRHGKRAVVSEE